MIEWCIIAGGPDADSSDRPLGDMCSSSSSTGLLGVIDTVSLNDKQAQ
jgi:hypothetical protein